MIECKDCKHYKPVTDWNGHCYIELPAWLRQIVIDFTDSRFVLANDGCDLVKDKENAA